MIRGDISDGDVKGFLGTADLGCEVLVVELVMGEGSLAVLVVEVLACLGETGTGLVIGEGHLMIRWSRYIVTGRHFDRIIALLYSTFVVIACISKTWPMSRPTLTALVMPRCSFTASGM